MSLGDPSRQERIEEFLRKSLLGEEIINTQFHLFSARSVSLRRVTKPRVLCANNVLLARTSKYFLDLLSSDINPADPSSSDLINASDVPSYQSTDDYGYGEDSDLDDDNEEPSNPLADIKDRKEESKAASATTPRIRIITKPKDEDELSDDGSESVSSDMFVMSPEHPRVDEPFGFMDMTSKAGSMTSAVQECLDKKTLGSDQTSMHLRSLGSRHVLVKDAAFRTWYTLLNYLYTDRVNFLPLSSATPGMQPRESSMNPQDEPKCSAKSMYRLACKVGLDDLRNEALAYVRSNLTEHNILTELSCSIVSSHPELLEMELDVLYAHIGSAPVIADFPAVAKRIAGKMLPHGADIIVGIHARLLKERQPLPPMQTTTSPTPPLSPSSASIVPGSSPAGAEPPRDTAESEPAVQTPLCESDTEGVPLDAQPSVSGFFGGFGVSKSADGGLFNAQPSGISVFGVSKQANEGLLGAQPFGRSIFGGFDESEPVNGRSCDAQPSGSSDSNVLEEQIAFEEGVKASAKKGGKKLSTLKNKKKSKPDCMTH